MGEIDRPEDILLEDLESGLRLQNAPDTVFLFVRKAWRGITERGGVTAAISGFVTSEADEIRRNTVRTILSLIIKTADARLTAHTLAVSAGIYIPGIESEIQIASMYGISRQAVSKRATETCRELGIRPSGFMRSEEAQDAYRDRENKKIAGVKNFLVKLHVESHTYVWEVYP